MLRWPIHLISFVVLHRAPLRLLSPCSFRFSPGSLRLFVLVAVLSLPLLRFTFLALLSPRLLPVLTLLPILLRGRRRILRFFRFLHRRLVLRFHRFLALLEAIRCYRNFFANHLLLGLPRILARLLASRRFFVSSFGFFLGLFRGLFVGPLLGPFRGLCHGRFLGLFLGLFPRRFWGLSIDPSASLFLDYFLGLFSGFLLIAFSGLLRIVLFVVLLFALHPVLPFVLIFDLLPFLFLIALLVLLLIFLIILLPAPFLNLLLGFFPVTILITSFLHI
mmetsp:Transcript_28985/g.79816  ORF Transcript_28985/g.79816 Transcript_28985/m.79816 type:complete len:276 (+) Transcript_28985:484-1311(+)